MSNPYLPAPYKWIENIPNNPKMIVEGLSLLGIKEIPGKDKNNPRIMSMAKDIGLTEKEYPDDETAWCALAHSWLCWKAGKPLPGKKYDLLRAKSFETWGNEVMVPMYGDTLVFKRGIGDERHVGLLIGEDIGTYHIMGGNQGNSYSIARMNKNRLLTARRLYLNGVPASVKQRWVSPIGHISQNEA